MSSRAFLWINFLNKHLYLITVVKNVGFYLLVCFWDRVLLCTPEGPGTHYIDQTHCLPVSSDGIKGVACNKCVFFISPQHAQALVYTREAVCHCAVPKACFYDFFFNVLKQDLAKLPKLASNLLHPLRYYRFDYRCVSHTWESIFFCMCVVYVCVFRACAHACIWRDHSMFSSLALLYSLETRSHTEPKACSLS